MKDNKTYVMNIIRVLKCADTEYFRINGVRCVLEYNKLMQQHKDKPLTRMQKYYILNRDKIIEKNSRYRKVRPDMYNNYYQSNIEAQRLYKKMYYRAYREKNKAKMAARATEYYKKYYQENKTHILTVQKKRYYKNNNIA